MLPNTPRGGTIVTDVTQPDQEGSPEAAAGKAAAAEPAQVTAPKPAVDARAVIDHEISEPVFETEGLAVSYSGKPAVLDVSLRVPQKEITAFIGPSGCGKSTILRCFDRMNDLIPAAKVDGKVMYHGLDLYGDGIDAVQVRKRIGMVFQKPNPFPKSIFDNIAFGPRIRGMKGSMDEIVESALRRAALWDDVKDRLKDNAFGMSGGQQQRLCIARTIAVKPEVILMDEPCSALDPIATARIEELIDELRENFCIIIVTHSMQQAARVSQLTAFFHLGTLVEAGDTDEVFTAPQEKRTQDYITGRFG